LQNNFYTYLYMTNMLQRDVSTNLMFTDVVNRQVDGIFGSLGSVCETMLQSQWGELHLLPAVPAKWTNGLVSGLRARGGFEVGINWTNNRLASASVTSLLGNPCRIRSRWPIDVKLGTNYVAAPMIYPGVYEFATLAGSNYSVLPATVFETENLAPTSSAGDAHTAFTNSAFSNARGTRLTANAAADFVSYTLTNIPAGNWRIHVVADCGTNRGRFQTTSGPGGALTNVGPVCDTYCVTNVFALYPSNGLMSQILWTNMLKEFDCGDWTAPTNGNYEFRFTVVDKNAASAGYWLSFDHIKLTPANAVASPEVPPLLIAQAFGSDLVLSWPTNASAFGLEFATELPATNWNSATPPALTSGESLVVTNAMTAEKVFYRLRKP
jgi:hypothetical protein